MKKVIQKIKLHLNDECYIYHNKDAREYILELGNNKDKEITELIKLDGITIEKIYKRYLVIKKYYEKE